MSFLRQSTQVVVKLGPYLDATDGVTEEVGLAGAGKEISKEPGAAFGTGPTLGTHDAEGWYPVTLTTTHTNTVGRLLIKGQASATHLPVWHEFTVVEEAVYDRDYAAAATGVDADWTNAGRLDTLLDAIPTTAMRGTDSAALASVATEARLAELDAGNLPTDIAAIPTTAMRGTDGALTDKAGFSLAATGLDLILVTSTFVAALIKGVWDRVLNGANHNITNSSGRRLRQIQEAGGYSGGAVYVDTVGGTTGTTDFENGVDSKQSKNIADANTIAASVILSKFVIAPNSSITFAATQDGQVFEGSLWTLALGGRQVNETHIIGAEVSGICTGHVHMDHCHLGVCSFEKGEFADCGLDNTFTITGAESFILTNCYHEEDGAPSTIDFGSAVGVSEVHVHGWKGALLVRNMDTGDILHFSSAEGTLELDSSNTAGTLNISGTPKLTNNSSGMTTNDNRDQALILADTNELQTDWADGGRLDAILDLTALEATVAALNDFDPALDTVALVTLVTTVTNNSDMRGTDSAALASVLGALNDAAAAGDPTSADTVMQYIKQLINLLAGSAGIGTMPSAADPANGVNLFEMLRAAMGATFATATDSLEQLQGGVAAIPTTAMRGTDSAALASVATESRLAELDAANIPADVDAIKVPTDKMVFTKANELDGNMKSINDAEVIGDGNATPWDGA